MSHVHAYIPLSFYILIYCLVGAFLIVSLSLSLFLALVCFTAPKRKSTLSQNPLHSRASTSSSNPTPSHVRFCDDKAQKDSFLDEAFIPNAKSSYRIFLILTYPLLSTVGVGSHCVASRSFVLS